MMSATQHDDTELIPAIGYWRVSRAREEMISPDLQQAAISDWARRSGRRITGWVGDPNATGRTFLRRVMNAISAVERGEAAEIIVYRYDRWGRNAMESLANVRRVELAGGSVVSATEPLDPETAIGEYNRTNSFALAEMQSKVIGENWKAVIKSRTDRQLPGNGAPRFGYERLGKVPDGTRPHQYVRDPHDLAGERYEPGPVNGPVLAELYRRYIAGDGCLRLIRWLTEAGVATNRGSRWSPRTLYSVLDSGFGAGLLRVHDPACRCKGHLNSVRNRGGAEIPACKNAAWIPGAQPAVITMAEWEAYRDRRQRLKAVPSGVKGSLYPLSGLMRCGACAGRLTVASHDGNRGAAYRCADHVRDKTSCPGVWVRRAAAEAAVLEFLAATVADVEAAASVRKARTRAVADAAGARARLERQLAKNDQDLTRLLLQHASDEHMPAGPYESARARLLADRADIEAALAAAAGSQKANSGEFLDVIRPLLESWPLLPGPRRREMLGGLLREVRVHPTGRRQPPRIEIIAIWETGQRQPG